MKRVVNHQKGVFAENWGLFIWVDLGICVIVQNEKTMYYGTGPIRCGMRYELEHDL
jgi:hypothetical protein